MHNILLAAHGAHIEVNIHLKREDEENNPLKNPEPDSKPRYPGEEPPIIEPDHTPPGVEEPNKPNEVEINFL